LLEKQSRYTNKRVKLPYLKYFLFVSISPRLKNSLDPPSLSCKTPPLISRLQSKALFLLKFKNSRSPRILRRLLSLLSSLKFTSNPTEFSSPLQENLLLSSKRSLSTQFSSPLIATSNPSGSRSTNLNKDPDQDASLTFMMLSLMTSCSLPLLLESALESDSMDLPSSECKKSIIFSYFKEIFAISYCIYLTYRIKKIRIMHLK